MEIKNLLEKLNIKNNQKGCNTGGIWIGEGEILSSFSPVNVLLLGTVQGASVQDYEHILDKAEHAFLSFRAVPAPKRGDLVRQLGNKLREKKILPWSVSFLGNGKILTRRFRRGSRNDRYL